MCAMSANKTKSVQRDRTEEEQTTKIIVIGFVRSMYHHDSLDNNPFIVFFKQWHSSSLDCEIWFD